MDSAVKIRLMLAMVGARKGPDHKAVEAAYGALLELAVRDEDEWVQMVGASLHSLLTSGRVLPPMEEKMETLFKSTAESLRDQLASHGAWLLDVPPLESRYLDMPSPPVQEHTHFQRTRTLNRDSYGLFNLTLDGDGEGAATHPTAGTGSAAGTTSGAVGGMHLHHLDGDGRMLHAHTYAHTPLLARRGSNPPTPRARWSSAGHEEGLWGAGAGSGSGGGVGAGGGGGGDFPPVRADRKALVVEADDDFDEAEDAPACLSLPPPSLPPSHPRVYTRTESYTRAHTHTKTHMSAFTRAAVP